MNIRLKEFRIANEIPQERIAKTLALSQSAVSRLEALGRDLSEIQIGKLCEEYGREKVMKFVGNPAPPEVNLSKKIVSKKRLQCLLKRTKTYPEPSKRSKRQSRN